MIDSIVFDWKRTLYDPDNKVLLSGCVNLLRFLRQKNIPLILLGKGDETLKEEVQKLGVGNYFKEIQFVGNKKTENMFVPFINNSNPKNCWIIGDRAQAEIAIAKKIGCSTIWIKQGKFATEEPILNLEPDMTVYSLKECKKYLKTLLV